MTSRIHPTAVIAPGAQLGLDVEIGPHTVVGAGVRIGDRTRIGPQVVLDGNTTLGADNVVVGQASLGGPPQDLSYRGEATELVIGDRNTVREFVTVNRGTVKGGGVTRIGSDCLLMACCHVAHDCDVEDRVILANGALLAGHVHVGRGAAVSGGCAAHHFITIGQYAYVGGMSRLPQDVPPFMLVEGHPARVRRVNDVGLERAGFSPEEIESLHVAFKRLWRSKTTEPRRQVLRELREAGGVTGPVLALVEALERTELGLKGRYRESLRNEYARQGRERVLGEVLPASQDLPVGAIALEDSA
jgi:UDP-N-acetylglucosamine acyltransferase